MQEIFDNDHRVVSQRGSSSGRFTFSSAESGNHKICFTPSSTSGRSGWTSVSKPNGGIRLQLDLIIGETNEIESTDKSKLEDIATRVKDLNARLKDIRREQVFQRVRLRHSRLGSCVWVLTWITGTGGRVQRSVRDDQQPRHSLDPHSAGRARRHVYLAAVQPALVLHQAEAHVKPVSFSELVGAWVGNDGRYMRVAIFLLSYARVKNWHIGVLSADSKCMRHHGRDAFEVYKSMAKK